MRGTNTMTLNEDTMVDALQEYFDSRMLHSYKITVVSVKHDSSLTGAEKFTVTVEEKAADDE